MTPVYVASSNLDCIGYRLGTLYVRFKHGECYAYHHVPFTLYEGLRDAESVGRFLNQNIKGVYDYTRLVGDPFIVAANEGSNAPRDPSTLADEVAA
jgi:hypothetical protein